MKTTILYVALLFGTLLPSCSDMTTMPEEPKAIYVQQNSDATYSLPEAIKERPNRDTTKKDTVRKAPPTIFGDLLAKLNLTPDQKVIVERLLIQHRACIDECVKPLKAAEKEILERARLQEQEIKKAVETGKITRAQAREKLFALKEKTKKALKELPVRAKVQECIKSCDAAFIDSLAKILSPDQKITLISWLDARSKRGSDKKDTVVVKRG